MKNLINIIAVLTISFSSVFASTTPTIDMEAVTIGKLEIFTSVDFDTETENLSFTTNDDISAIQIFDADGTMVFQLPVMTNNVKINKNLFDAGTYKLGFLLEGQSQVHATQVTIR